MAVRDTALDSLLFVAIIAEFVIRCALLIALLPIIAIYFSALAMRTPQPGGEDGDI